MTPLQTQLLTGSVLAVGIAALSRALRLLSTSGAIAAAVVGFAAFGCGGIAFGAPLLVFFLSSSLVSRIGRGRKAAQQTHYDKSHTRDAGQVLANGGVAALLAAVHLLGPDLMSARVAAMLYVGSLAAVNADTWATEIGGLWRGRPFMVTNLRRVEAGISGAVSPFGLVAALVGAFVVVGAAWLAWPARSPLMLWRPDGAELMAMGWAGFVASFGDSVLGASVQAQYRCAACGKLTESRFHCDGPAILKRGRPFITNDVVNFLTSLMGALFTWILLSSFANTR